MHLPEWMPGAGFKRQARIWREFSQSFCDLPFQHTKRKMQSGTAAPSFTSLALSELEEKVGREYEEKADRDYEEYMIKSIAATLYTGAPAFHRRCFTSR
jgi:hypothetical protein